MVGRAQYPSGHRNLVLQPPIITSGETAIYLHIFGKRASGRGFCWCSTHFQLGSTPPKPKNGSISGTRICLTDMFWNPSKKKSKSG